MPGKNPRDVQLYREGFAGLKQIGYQGYCSFECGNIDTFKEQFASSMDFLRIIWSQV
jgi:sugar phosphate isomerase/epimerase